MKLRSEVVMSNSFQTMLARLNSPTFKMEFLQKYSDNRTIYFVNALCGAGKSLGSLRYAIRRALDGKDTILVFKSLLGGDEIVNKPLSLLGFSDQERRKLEKRLSKPLGELTVDDLPFVKRIDSKNRWISEQRDFGEITDESTPEEGRRVYSDATPIQAEIMIHLSRENPLPGEILLITHSALLRMLKNPSVGDWSAKMKNRSVIIDEVLPLYETSVLNLTETSDFLIPLVTARPSWHKDYVQLEPDQKSECQRKLSQRATNESGDTQVGPSLQATAYNVLAGNIQCLTSAENWEHIESKDFSQLIVHNLQVLELLFACEECIVLCANFERTLFAKLAQVPPFYANVERCWWIPVRSRGIAKHANKERVTIYALTQRNWSKERCKRPFKGKKVIEHAIEACLSLDELKKDGFIFLANKRGKKFNHPSARQLPYACEGSNEFRDYRHCVIIAALNAAPYQIKFFKDLGFSSRDLDEAIFCQTAYQAVTRTGIRNLDDEADHIFVVPTLSQARYLADLFSNSEVKLLQSPILELDAIEANSRSTSTPSSGRQRTRLSRNREMVREVLLHNRVDPIYIETMLETTASNPDWINVEGSLKHGFPKGCNEAPIRDLRVTDLRGVTSSISHLCLRCAVVPFSSFNIKYHSFPHNQRVSPGGVQEELPWPELTQLLTLSASREYHAKRKPPQMTTAIFGELTKKGRTDFGLKNCLSAQLLVFNLNSIIGSDEWSQVLPGVELFAYETVEEGVGGRIIIPLALPVPGKVYWYVWEQVRVELERLLPGVFNDYAGTPNHRFRFPQTLGERPCGVHYQIGLPLNPCYFSIRFGMR